MPWLSGDTWCRLCLSFLRVSDKVVIWIINPNRLTRESTRAGACRSNSIRLKKTPIEHRLVNERQKNNRTKQQQQQQQLQQQQQNIFSFSFCII